MKDIVWNNISQYINLIDQKHKSNQWNKTLIRKYITWIKKSLKISGVTNVIMFTFIEESYKLDSDFWITFKIFQSGKVRR